MKRSVSKFAGAAALTVGLAIAPFAAASATTTTTNPPATNAGGSAAPPPEAPQAQLAQAELMA
ncbi:MAG: hypothetical protein HC895_23460 [Leptolyngbyaceae cyanobacterium SM1_3_5]|nr:hypothetical protein [Leptolyngbyaceae cyanobacterium SM1_3_5]